MNTLAFFCNITTEKFLDHTVSIEHYKKEGSFGNDQTRYKEYCECAVNSFKKWHPDVPVVFVDDSNVLDYLKLLNNSKLINSAIGQKFNLGLEVMKYYKAEKLIILDIDTITCSRVEEMLDDNEHDILVSMNFNRFENTEYWTPPSYVLEYEDGREVTEIININSGVVCFNNVKALERALELTINHPTAFGDQGALNELLWTKEFTFRVLDGPYITSPVVYNVRAKGVNENNTIFQIAMNNPEQSYIRHWYVKDGKLFTPDHKHIRVWHIAEGLHGRPKEDFDNITQMYKKHLFNADTIKFFEEECACKGFFN